MIFNELCSALQRRSIEILKVDSTIEINFKIGLYINERG
jgi:hypothetical protein